jgi:very-short-patch-repair endonuclease
VELDAAIGRFAERQLGLITHEQALAFACSRRQIQHRVERGVWERVRPRVYLIVGSPRSWTQTVLSAVLSSGEGAVASHRTAARLWRLPIGVGDSIEVSIPIERRVRIRGVTAHRSGVWHELDISHVSGVPTTTPARRLCDISSTLGVDALGRALDEGLRRGIVSLSAMHAVARRFAWISPGRSPKAMTAVLTTRIPGYDPGDSDLETDVWDALVQAGLPRPERLHRVRLDGRVLTVDLAYPAQHVAIEVDGFSAHGTRTAFDIDRIRQNALVLAGWTVLRFTSRSTLDEIVATVRTALFGNETTPRVVE